MEEKKIIGYNPNTGEAIYEGESIPEVENTKKKSVLKKVLIIVGIFVAIFIAIFVSVYNNSNKLICKSDEGNITIMYNDKTITGYTAVGIKYDLSGQKQIAKQLGVDAYMESFIDWFEENTTGSCKYSKK